MAKTNESKRRDRSRCPVHDGQIHGGEAEELREGIESIISRRKLVSVRELRALLDRVDARDSLAYLERRKVART